LVSVLLLKQGGFDRNDGNIAAYDGNQWVSDFIQKHGNNDFYGGPYRKDRLPAIFYRYYGLTLPRSSRRRIKPIYPHCTSELKFEQGRDGPKADDPVTCYFHGFIGTRA